MSIRISAKKAAIVAIMVAPLTLAACGSDDENTAASSTTTQTSTTASSTGKTSTTTEATTEETPQEVTEETTEEIASEPAAEVPAPAPEQNQTLVNDPVITYNELAPVEGGQAANPEEAAALESLIRGATTATTFRSMVEYIPNNTCNRVIEAAGGQAAMDFSMFPDVPLSQIPGVSAGTIDSISDITVQGDSASAWVVASGNGTTDSGTQRFLREDGRWKFCD